MKRLPISATALALSAVFAISSIVPAQAFPVPSAQQQQVKQSSDVENVKVVRRNHGRNFKGHNYKRHNYKGHSYRNVHRGTGRDPLMNGNRHGWRGNHRNAWRGNYARHNYRSWHGHRGYSYYRPGYRQYNGWWYPAAAFTTGVVIGTTVYRGGGNSHVRWCSNNYASYRVSDNTFQPYNGPRRQCISP